MTELLLLSEPQTIWEGSEALVEAYAWRKGGWSMIHGLRMLSFECSQILLIGQAPLFFPLHHMTRTFAEITYKIRIFLQKSGKVFSQ